jgi:hypothetical protein
MARETTVTIIPAASITDIEAVCALFRQYEKSLSFSLDFQGF